MSSDKLTSDSFAEGLRDWLRREVQTTGDLLGLPAACERAELATINYLQATLFDELIRLVSSQSTTSRVIGAGRIDISGTRIELRLAPKLRTPSVLEIAIEPIIIDPNRSRSKLFKISADTVGRLQAAELTIDPVLEQWGERLVQIVKIILEAQGRWLKQYVDAELSKMKDELASSLYRIVREVLSEVAATEVWLFSLTKDHGVYLSDPIRRDRALARAAERRVSTPFSPLEHLVELSTRLLDPLKVFGAEVLAQDKTLEANITHAQYDSQFELAEEAVFQTTRLVCQPLVKEGSARLVAGYPIEFREEIEPLLQRERERFRKTLIDGTSSLRQLVRSLHSVTIVPGVHGQLGEFVGGILKQLATQ